MTCMLIIKKREEVIKSWGGGGGGTGGELGTFADRGRMSKILVSGGIPLSPVEKNLLPSKSVKNFKSFILLSAPDLMF